MPMLSELFIAISWRTN